MAGLAQVYADAVDKTDATRKKFRRAALENQGVREGTPDFRRQIMRLASNKRDAPAAPLVR